MTALSDNIKPDAMILRRLPGERFSEVLPGWRGETVVILGGGPSLTLEQVALVAEAHKLGRVKCVAVNDAYLLAPWADLDYAADSHWHAWHTAGISKPKLGLTAEQVRARWAAFAGQKCTIQNSGRNVQDDAVHMLRNKTFPNHSMGLSRDPCALITGWSSGFQALNLATLAGALLALLLGFDARDGQAESHWHGGHPRDMPVMAYEQFRRAFSMAEHDLTAAGVRVINCSPGSAINSFVKLPLAEALALEVEV